ncbi:MAG: HIT family protein [Candidatus Micrarchaeia archaeon]
MARNTNNDPFCSPSIKGSVFFESKNTMVVYDIAPVTKGHCLIIPKRHTPTISDLKKYEITDIFVVLKQILPVLLEYYSDETKSYNFIAQVGKSSGMSIPHLHFHLIPRNKNTEDSKDGINHIYKDIDSKRRLSKDEYYKEVLFLRKLFDYKANQYLKDNKKDKRHR